MKLRPAVVLADVGRGDYILSQITSKHTPTRDESPRAASVDGPGELTADAASTADIRLRFMGTPYAAKTHAMNLMETIREVSFLTSMTHPDSHGMTQVRDVAGYSTGRMTIVN